ncbi:hypothetical protein [Aliarcobacter butzleri]|uniref:hypothetical protein n=1 Tax=Aliarcobacter butzleri TaxID=28197 RepID=UPI0012F71103|nr:hypothetical protein [Aliarcobacter butzleri]
MSKNESFDIDLVRKEEQEKFTKEDENNLDEFVGMLQDAFHFGNKNLDEELVYISIEKVFKEYFEANIKIKKAFPKAFLKVS